MWLAGINAKIQTILEKDILLAELTKNCEGKKEKLSEFMKTYELAKLGREVMNQRFKDIENKVLQENEFFCGRSDVYSRCDEQPKFGERIADAKWSFLLSDEDFDRLQAATLPYEVEAGLTDDKGFFITNWHTIECKARGELVNYIIDEIVPEQFRDSFKSNSDRIVFQDKLINAFKMLNL